MAGHDIIAVGASAGGVEALMALARDLPADLPAAVFVVLHIPAQSPSLLPALLNRSGPLVAQHPADGTPIEPGRIYVAPPDHHLLIEPGRVRVIRGPRENRHRPAVDPLLRTAALAYGPRVVGVILTGSLDDGTAGLLAVKQRGGLAIVQDPAEALYSSMPQTALENVAVDHVLRLAEIPPMLARLAHIPAAEGGHYPVSREMVLESKIAGMDMATLQGNERPGTPSPFSCPECKGVLYELHDGDLLRFRCRVGHAYSAESALADQAQALEDALWVALNTLQESAQLAERMAQQARERGHDHLAAHFETKGRESDQRAAVIRQVLLKDETTAVLNRNDTPPDML
jgi:two-component system chemotaxis response regulator CheB